MAMIELQPAANFLKRKYFMLFVATSGFYG